MTAHRWALAALFGASLLAAAITASLIGACSTPAPSSRPTSSTPPRPSIIDEVDPIRLMETLRALPTRRAAAGTQEDRDGLIATEALIDRSLRELGYTPTVETFYWTAIPGVKVLRTEPDGTPVLDPAHAQPVQLSPDTRPALGTIGPWHNYVVEIKGSEKPDEVILVGAHFDAYLLAPGADDNATGVAALLELARVLRDRPLKRTVRLAFFNLEEVGLVGSRHHAAQWLAQRSAARDERIVLMLSLEMLGYFSDAPNSQKSPMPPIKGVFEPPTVGDFIGLATTQKHAATLSAFESSLRRAQPTLKVFSTSVFPDVDAASSLLSFERNILRSDHAAFLLIGQPGIIVTDTSNFRNPHYHTPSDTIDTIDAPRFALVTRALAGAIADWATPEPSATTAPTPPQPSGPKSN